MKRRRVGRSGLTVSEISYGNWLTHGMKVDYAAAKACVDVALEQGITAFDTADVYAQGEAEVVLGRALKGVARENIELCSKTYFRVGPGHNEQGLSRKHIMEACNASLRRLDTDYIDLYQAHRFDPATPLEETLRAFADLVQQGKILYFGVSEWRALDIERAAALAREGRYPTIISD